MGQKIQCVPKNLPDSGLVPQGLTRDGRTWFHLARSAVAGFVLYFMWAGIAFVTGLTGCWKSSGEHLVTTALVLLTASLCGGAGMGLWHAARYGYLYRVAEMSLMNVHRRFYEMEKVRDVSLGFFLSWPDEIREK